VKGDRVQFFGSIPLAEGGFPYRGDALVVEIEENNQVILDSTPASVEAGDYMCKATDLYGGD